MYPFRRTTVTHAILYSVGFISTFLTIVVTEFIRGKQNLDSETSCPKEKIYKIFRIFLIGFLCIQTTTSIAKYSIGRFRPHFITVCQPIFPHFNTTCSDPVKKNRYITDFFCGNNEVTPARLNEMRLSFPSGHASFSMYAMIFVVLYLHYRMDWRDSKLLKPVLQFIFIMLAWYTALSRISDYENHCKLAIISDSMKV